MIRGFPHAPWTPQSTSGARKPSPVPRLLLSPPQSFSLTQPQTSVLTRVTGHVPVPHDRPPPTSLLFLNQEEHPDSSRAGALCPPNAHPLFQSLRGLPGPPTTLWTRPASPPNRFSLRAFASVVPWAGIALPWLSSPLIPTRGLQGSIRGLLFPRVAASLGTSPWFTVLTALSSWCELACSFIFSSPHPWE